VRVSRVSFRPGLVALAVLWLAACGHDAARPAGEKGASGAAGQASSGASSQGAATQPQPVVPTNEQAPPASQTGGFDGAKAYEHVAKLVAIGPRQPGSEGIHRAQQYIRAQLQSSGCAVDEDDFNAQTPIGNVAMKNIVAKAPGEGRGIILLLTHYDTLRLKDFVGAEDSGSSTGLMLEMARLLCGKKGPNAVWIAFLDGEEAFVNWNQDEDHTYGSRELAARMALSGDLAHVRAVILADMIGQNGLEIMREGDSTKWLTDLVWKTADRLGYKSIFVSRQTSIQDDHDPFLDRQVPAVDIIDYDGFLPYWHTPQDTLDKVSPRSLAIVGHVILESVNELQKKQR
jgi:glutaminyl-peptide cyclotransferase